MLELVGLALERRKLGPISSTVDPGEIILLCGRSGSGKSTLCQLLCGRGEPSEGSVVKSVELGVGFLAHDFENQLLGTTVEDELYLGASRPISSEQLEAALAKLTGSLRRSFQKSPHALSKAEQQILLLCSLVRAGSRLLVLDESLAHLDLSQWSVFWEAIQGFRAAGVTFILVSHQPEVLGLVDRVWALVEGKLVFDGKPGEVTPELMESVGFSGDRGRLCRFRRHEDRSRAISLFFEPNGDRLALEEGSVLMFGGFAGSGKTGSLESLYGIGSVGQWSLETEELARCFLRQSVGPSFWRRTVEHEWSASVGSFKGLSPELESEYLSLLPESWRERSPLQLSHGQLRFFATLCLVAQNPRILFLDQPFQGLDGELRNRLSIALDRFIEYGGSLVIASSSLELIENWADTVVWLENGECKWVGCPEGDTWESFKKTLLPLGAQPKKAST